MMPNRLSHYAYLKNILRDAKITHYILKGYMNTENNTMAYTENNMVVYPENNTIVYTRKSSRVDLWCKY